MAKGAKRRRPKVSEDEGGSDGDGEGAPAKKKWKAVELNLEMLKDFESDGGLFIEEADENEVGVTYGDGRATFSRKKGRDRGAAKADRLDDAMSATKNGKKKKNIKASRAKEAPHAEKPVDLESENSKLRKELDELKQQKREMDDAKAEASMPHWARFELNPSILRGLFKLGFKTPTRVQDRCLVPAIRQRKDIVGAAETGSGKTLAFGLPILHHTLQAMEQEQGTAATSQGLRALIILPTRELAVQVRGHINAVAEGTSVLTECVVGGMSVLKQKRVLKKKPQIVVGTPGRIFALLGLGKDADEEKCDWLRDAVRGLRHLVLDEADRLVEAGHFRELDRIVGHVYDSLERAQQLQTFVFSATLTLDPSKKWKRGGAEDEDSGKVAQLMRRLRFREARAVHTVDLTKEESADKDAKNPEGTANGTTDAIVDLPTSSASSGGGGAGVRQLPERLAFFEAIASDDKDREAMLAVWLLRRYRWEAAASSPSGTVAASGGGQIVIFVNAITMVMRLAPVIALLLESPAADKVLARVRMKQDKGRSTAPPISVEVIGLHSKMRQKERLKKMERFRKSRDAVLVCTDIAARGLDVPALAAVLHYQAPRGVEVFVHRSGRTARAGRSGESIAFMAPKDASAWGNLYRAAKIPKSAITDVVPNAFEVSAAKEAIRLAIDLESKVHKMSKEHQDRCWFAKAAEEADIMLDDDGDEREHGKSSAPRKLLWGLYQQLIARTRRPPKRYGGGPLPKHQRP